MKIYTKTGDDGSTGLLGPGRVAKCSLRIDAYGTVDELNAAIGMARAASLDADSDSRLARVQDDLFVVGAALADPSPSGPFHASMKGDRAERLEIEIDELEASLPPLTQFILPGGTPGAAHVHLARTICRRAERGVVALGQSPEESVPTELVVYLNRLSDFLFVLARTANARAGVGDVPWVGL